MNKMSIIDISKKTEPGPLGLDRGTGLQVTRLLFPDQEFGSDPAFSDSCIKCLPLVAWKEEEK